MPGCRQKENGERIRGGGGVKLGCVDTNDLFLLVMPVCIYLILEDVCEEVVRVGDASKAKKNYSLGSYGN